MNELPTTIRVPGGRSRHRHDLTMLLLMTLSGCGIFNQMDVNDLRSLQPAPKRATSEACKWRLDEHLIVSDSTGKIPKDPHNGDLATAFRTVMHGYARDRQSGCYGHEPLRLLFYFNGGLNSQDEIEAQALKQVPEMLADGYYPVFFVWDTGFPNSYAEQTFRVHDGQISEGLSRTLLRGPLRFVGDVASGIATSGDDFVRRELANVLPLNLFSPIAVDPAIDVDCLLNVRHAAGCAIGYNELQLQLVTAAKDKVPNNQTPASQVVASDFVDKEPPLLGRLWQHLMVPARLFTTPMAVGLGTPTWENYLRRTRVTIRRAEEFNFDKHDRWTALHHSEVERDSGVEHRCSVDYKTAVAAFPRGLGAFAMFFESLLQFQNKSDEGRRDWQKKHEGIWYCDRPAPESPGTAHEPDPRQLDDAIASAARSADIVLIGHSMGAIVVNSILERFPELHISDIVVMASAASARDTRRVLDRYYETDCPIAQAPSDNHGTAANPTLTCEQKPLRPPARFYSLMLHPLNDIEEQNFLATIPLGSLLMWVDDLYEIPKTPEDKTFGFWPTARSMRRMFGRAAQEHMVFRVFDRREDEHKTTPVTHSGFNDTEKRFWCRRFWDGSPDNGRSSCFAKPD